jgi:hypothetical protein
VSGFPECIVDGATLAWPETPDLPPSDSNYADV